MATSTNGGNNQLSTSIGASSFGGNSNPLDGGGLSATAFSGGSSSSGSMGDGGFSGGSGNPTGGGGSASGGSNPNSLGQSPWGRLSEVGITDLGSLFSGVGGQSGGNPFADNPVAAQVLFGGSGNSGGSLFSNLRTNIDTLVSGATGGNPSGGGASTEELSDPFALGGAFGIPSADSFDLASYGIPSASSFGGG